MIQPLLNTATLWTVLIFRSLEDYLWKPDPGLRQRVSVCHDPLPVYLSSNLYRATSHLFLEKKKKSHLYLKCSPYENVSVPGRSSLQSRTRDKGGIQRTLNFLDYYCFRHSFLAFYLSSLKSLHICNSLEIHF